MVDAALMQKRTDSMTGLWSATQCAFASCAPMSSTPEQGTSELVLRTMESEHTNLDSPLSEEGIEMEFDKPLYCANARSEDAKRDKEDKNGNLPTTRVEDSTHGKGVVDDATTTVEAPLQSNPMGLKKKVSRLLQRRWSIRSDRQSDAIKHDRTTQIIGEVPDATVATSSEDSSADSLKEKNGSDSTFEGSGMFPGERKHVAAAVVLKRTQQKSRTPHARDDVSTLSSSTGGHGASKIAESGEVSPRLEKDVKDNTSRAKTNDTLQVKIDDINMLQFATHRVASIQNAIVVKDVATVKREATITLQKEPVDTCGPSATVKTIAAIPQGTTLSKTPICQYDVSLMRKPLFEPEDDDSDDEDAVNHDVGILKMVAKRSLVKDCFQMDMKEPDLWRYNFNQCNQGPKIQDATAGQNQDRHVTDALFSRPTPLDKSTNTMDTVEISVAETDEKRVAKKSFKKPGFFGRFCTRRSPRSSPPSLEKMQYHVSSGDNTD
jgi:hypothetical protein